VDKIIRNVGADEVICLGDAFDDFDDTPDMVKHTCEWLINFVNTPNHIFIGGNHDIQYMYPYRTFQCSGFAQWKYFIIRDMVDQKVWDKLKWYHFLDNRWLLTHGGLHNSNVPKRIHSFMDDRKVVIEKINDWLDNEIRTGLKMGAQGKSSWVFNAGFSRGGGQAFGGITWCDFLQEFYPIKGINQIVGHTAQQRQVKWCRIPEMNGTCFDGKIKHDPAIEWCPTIEQLDDTKQSCNIDIDVWGNMHWAVWNGTKLTFGNYKDL
jgi:hypothetical protein